MLKTYKIFSILLSYPDEEIQEFLKKALTELKSECILKPEEITGIEKFIHKYSRLPLFQWQEQYVQLFDFNRSVSLHLFEHIYGDSRDRGQAMNDLADEYLKTGIHMKAGELPDYLPAFLEYLSMLGKKEAADMISETVHILSAIQKRLEKKRQTYSYVFAALVSLSGKPANKNLVKTMIVNEKNTDFDSEYSEPQVTFDGTNSSCTNCKP